MQSRYKVKFDIFFTPIIICHTSRSIVAKIESQLIVFSLSQLLKLRFILLYQQYNLMEGKQSNLRDFQVLSKLGQGAFGQVFKVRRKADGKEYALKKVKIGAMKQKERQNALNEIRILASYNQEYIIGYKQAFYDDVSSSLCVVMEFAAGGDILKRNQTHQKNHTKYREQQIWRALVHMTRGLRSLHERKILHRDLKSANIFITADNIYKLGDLNVSKVVKKDMAQTQTGTPYYASPQVWKDKPYGLKSDMWSLGCVLYEMAALRPPFTATDLQGLYKKICTGIFQRIPSSYSNELSSIITSLLKVDPQKRPNTDQILLNPVVAKNFRGDLQQNAESQNFQELLKTIKYNPRDLKGLRNILPKANYEEDIAQKQELSLQQMKGGIQSCKNQRKQPSIQKQIKASLEQSEQRLVEYLQKRKILEQKERQRQIQLQSQEKNSQNSKRQRVLSACGLRPPPNLYQSPHVAVHNKNDSPIVPKPLKKEDPKPPIKLPPKPQGLNYKLPPKPTQSAQEPEKMGAQRKVSIKQEIVSTNRQAPSSSSGSRVNRSNSLQKVIYPSWWG